MVDGHIVRSRRSRRSFSFGWGTAMVYGVMVDMMGLLVSSPIPPGRPLVLLKKNDKARLSWLTRPGDREALHSEDVRGFGAQVDILRRSVKAQGREALDQRGKGDPHL